MEPKGSKQEQTEKGSPCWLSFERARGLHNKEQYRCLTDIISWFKL